MTTKTSDRYDRRCGRCGKRVPEVLREAHILAEDAIDEYLAGGEGGEPLRGSESPACYAPHTVEERRLATALKNSMPNHRTNRWKKRARQGDLFAFARVKKGIPDGP